MSKLTGVARTRRSGGSPCGALAAVKPPGRSPGNFLRAGTDQGHWAHREPPGVFRISLAHEIERQRRQLGCRWRSGDGCGKPAAGCSRSGVAPASDTLGSLVDELREVNLRLWTIEDDIRTCERRQEFGPAFVAPRARSI